MWLILAGLGYVLTVAAGVFLYRLMVARVVASRSALDYAAATILDLLNQLDAADAALAMLHAEIEAQNVVITRGLVKIPDAPAEVRAARVLELSQGGLSMSQIQMAVFGFVGGSAYKFVKKVVSTASNTQSTVRTA